MKSAQAGLSDMRLKMAGKSIPLLGCTEDRPRSSGADLAQMACWRQGLDRGPRAKSRLAPKETSRGEKEGLTV